MGYYPEQIEDLEKTIDAADCDTVVIGTPIDLRHIVAIQKPSSRVRYELADMEGGTLEEEISSFVGRHRG
jgi:predicted GTPase